ncbi:MAG: sigma 54 modulation/S30EA ribosomal C-terminal domain-containing protein [Actinomycetia bacterium]|nr:sigma 54 modulation/S30EA ribosomal C-terminal domain-containing protein [Actinomycetes bacterium]
MTKITAQVPAVQVEVGDDVAREHLEYARDKVTAALGHAPEPVLYARVRLRYAGDRAVARPAVAQVVADCNGRSIRTEFDAPTMHEAVDGLQSRLRRRLDRLARDWEELRDRRSPAVAHEWRHGDEPTRRPAHFPRPAGQREVVRRKAFELAAVTPDEAAFDLELHDYAFHLFHEIATDQDCVIARTPEGYRLSRLDPAVGESPGGAVTVELDPVPAPELSLAEATDRLGLTGAPFVFFRDTDSGQGCVLYLRYDGHYGLITPAA